MLGAHLAEPSVQATAALVQWLARVGERLDLSLPSPPQSSRSLALENLLATLAQEFTDYRGVVSGAREAARRNAEALAGVVQASNDQGASVAETAAAASAAGAGADLMAAAVDSLLSFAVAAAAAAADAASGLAHMGTALEALALRLSDGKAPLLEMRDSTDGVAAFLVTLARLSRNAQLLAVNASIEAAHLAEAGSRFAIVAREVRKLSVSTRESKADVSHIVAELRESTAQVAAAADDSSESTAAAAVDIRSAEEGLARTGRGINEFQRMVMTLADVAATQSMALQAVSSSIQQIAHHAAHAASASRETARLDLDTLLEGVERRVLRWTLRAPAAGVVAPGDRFEHWIAALCAGADSTTAAEVDSDPALGTLVAAVRSLIQQVNADGREVLANVVGVAIAASRDSYAWRSIGDSLKGVSHEISVVRGTVTESNGGAQTSADLARSMHDLADSIRTQYDRALGSLEGALARIAHITDSVRDIDRFVESMNAAAARAGQIMALIETLSSETDLLSLNAAIEAAHAGDNGRGFSIIAEEIRALARSTSDSTLSVCELVSKIARIGGELQSAIAAAAAGTHEITSSAQRVRQAITQLRGAFESAIKHARDVATAAGDQTRALERVRHSIDRTEGNNDADTAAATSTGRLELALLGSSAHAIAARRPLGTTIERVRAFAEPLCTALEAVFTAAIATGRLSVDELFAFAYRPIVGSEIIALRRLFDVSQVGEDGFAPVKYVTPWDFAIDEALIEVLERAYDGAAAFSPVTMFVSDLNGFFYAYPRRKIAAWTNDAAANNMGNRIKRMFEDDYALRVGRWGLGPAAQTIGERASYADFRSAGCTLSRTAQRPWGGFVYARDTNAVCNELVLGLYADGMRHSTLRICYDPTLI